MSVIPWDQNFEKFCLLQREIPGFSRASKGVKTLEIVVFDIQNKIWVF